MKGSKRPKGKGAWELRVTLGRDPHTGKLLQKSRTFRGGSRAADDALRKFVTEAQQGRFGGQRATVGSALDAWLEHRRSLGRSPTTLVNYAGKVAAIKASRLGAISLQDLTAEHVNGFYRERSLTDAPRTVLHYHRILSAAIDFAERHEWHEWVGRTPVARAEPPQVVHHDVYSPTSNEVRQLIDAAERSRQPDMATFMRIAALTGMRRGEVCGLQWSDVDWDNALVTVRRSVYQVPGEMGTKEPKGKRSRIVTLDDAGMFVMSRQHHLVQTEAAEASTALLRDAYVFSTTEDGSTPWSPNRVTQFVTRLRNRLELPDFHLHSLRSWSTTELVSAGIDIKHIAGRMGHADQGALLLQHYTQRRLDRDRSAAAVLSHALELTAD